MKKLSIVIQIFSEIIQKNYCYVDKTKFDRPVGLIPDLSKYSLNFCGKDVIEISPWCCNECKEKGII